VTKPDHVFEELRFELPVSVGARSRDCPLVRSRCIGKSIILISSFPGADSGHHDPYGRDVDWESGMPPYIQTKIYCVRFDGQVDAPDNCIRCLSSDPLAGCYLSQNYLLSVMTRRRAIMKHILDTVHGSQPAILFFCSNKSCSCVRWTIRDIVSARTVRDRVHRLQPQDFLLLRIAPLHLYVS